MSNNVPAADPTRYFVSAAKNSFIVRVRPCFSFVLYPQTHTQLSDPNAATVIIDKSEGMQRKYMDDLLGRGFIKQVQASQICGTQRSQITVIHEDKCELLENGNLRSTIGGILSMEQLAEIAPENFPKEPEVAEVPEEDKTQEAPESDAQDAEDTEDASEGDGDASVESQSEDADNADLTPPEPSEVEVEDIPVKDEIVLEEVPTPKKKTGKKKTSRKKPSRNKKNKK